MSNLRDSGIETIGNISWGAHISFLYSSKTDFKKVVAPFIKSGLENNELCIWVYSQNIDLYEANEILQASALDTGVYTRKGQLKLLPYTQWYTLDNSFNEVRVNRQWLDLVKYAKDNGFDGLRAVGDTAWLEKSYYREFSAYEHNVNGLFSELPFIALCLYDLNRISIPEASDIMRNHTFTIVTDGAELKISRNTELLVKERQLAESNRLIKELQEFDRLKTEFISNISHELRTPLNVILSTIQLARQFASGIGTDSMDDSVRSRLGKYAKMIQQNCYRQLRLVNNLIDISKIDAGYYELHLQNCNIVEIVENITVSVAEYIENKGISLTFDTNLEEIFTACDPDQIERIILNLLSNAVKFTPAGGSIMVDICGCEDKVIVSIKDTGSGIPNDKLARIFDRFSQVEATLAKNREGSGIGLSLVKSLVEKHNGRISVTSELNKGSVFTILLPLAIISDAEPVLSSKDKEISNRYIEKINVEFSDIYS